MAKISLGTQLNYKGYPCLCTRYERRFSETFALENSAAMEAQLRTLLNCHFMQMDIGPFDEGERIQVEIEYVELTAPNKGLYFIYTQYKAKKKEKEHGQQRVEGSTEQGSDQQAEAVDQ